jgi:putative transposase
MIDYRRIYTPGATWIFTVNLAERNNNTLLSEKIAIATGFSLCKAKTVF